MVDAVVTKGNNPANATPEAKGTRKRIPMSAPMSKLSVPDLPGFHLHWFKDTADRIQQALDAGYEFVDRKEVHKGSVSLGTLPAAELSTDMGSRVSVVAGGVGQDGQASRLILMKQRLEWYEEDQKLVMQPVHNVVKALTAGLIGSEKDDARDHNMRYVGNSRTIIPEMFKPKAPKVA